MGNDLWYTQVQTSNTIYVKKNGKNLCKVEQTTLLVTK